MAKAIDGAVILALTTAVLYSFGAAEFIGYLEGARLDSNILRRDFHQHIFYGGIDVFPRFIAAVLYAAIAHFVYTVVVAVYISYARQGVPQRRKLAKLRGWLKRHVLPEGPRTIAERGVRRRSARLGLVAFALSGYLLAVVLTAREGREQAEAVLEEHFAGSNQAGRMIRTTINGTGMTLRFLACGAYHCAGIADGSNRVFYFPVSQGFSFEVQP